MAAFTSTTTPLDADAEWISPLRQADRQDAVVGYVIADQDGTIFIEQSGDGVNWDISEEESVTANEVNQFSEDLIVGAWRIRFVNGSSDQTEFRLFAKTSSAGDS